MKKIDFVEIYNLYYKTVYKFILSICHNEHIAEEITQDTFYRAMQSYKNFRGDCKVQVWLCQIAKNTYYHYVKEQNKISNIDTFLNTVSDEEQAENFMLQSEQNLELHKILHNLEDPYKEIFNLRIFAELSYKEIGEIFSKTDSWARVTFHRAKLSILKQLKKENYDE